MLLLHAPSPHSIKELVSLGGLFLSDCDDVCEFSLSVSSKICGLMKCIALHRCFFVRLSACLPAVEFPPILFSISGFRTDYGHRCAFECTDRVGRYTRGFFI